MKEATSLRSGRWPVAKWFAILGTVVQGLLLVGIAFFFAGVIETFQEITASGSSDSRLLAQGIGEALVPVVLSLGIGVWGTFISLVTAIVSSYRSRWFFWSSAIFAVVYLIVLPMGTALGLAMLIFLVVKRHEFRKAPGEVGAIAKP